MFIQKLSGYLWCTVIVCLLHFIGCARNEVADEDILAVSEEVTAARDEYRGTMIYEGPIIKNESENEEGGSEIEKIRLVARSKANRSPRLFISIVDFYDGDWRGFDQAYDKDGNKFHALSVRHAVECTLLCGYEEILEVEINKNYLDLYSPHGITMKLYGPGTVASAPFTIPAQYIQGFMKGMYLESEETSGLTLHIDPASHAAP